MGCEMKNGIWVCGEDQIPHAFGIVDVGDTIDVEALKKLPRPGGYLPGDKYLEEQAKKYPQKPELGTPGRQPWRIPNFTPPEPQEVSFFSDWRWEPEVYVPVVLAVGGAALLLTAAAFSAPALAVGGAAVILGAVIFGTTEELPGDMVNKDFIS